VHWNLLWSVLAIWAIVLAIFVFVLWRQHKRGR
jgi:hypothetical protein